MDDIFSVTNLTKDKPPHLPFARIKECAVGKKYSVSLVFAGDRKTRSLNRIYRKKDTVPNVLSFPISKDEGEIFINLRKAKKDAISMETSYNKYVGLLFIHGLLHLKGFSHGKKMEKKEMEILSKFIL